MIRMFQHGDPRAVAEIFTSAVHEIASQVYTPEECLAWSAPICAKPMFEKLGFETTSEFFVQVRDIRLLNFRMEKRKTETGT